VAHAAQWTWRWREAIQQQQRAEDHEHQGRPAQPPHEAPVLEPEHREQRRQRDDDREHQHQPEQRARRHHERDDQLVQRAPALAYAIRAIERVDQRARGTPRREHGDEDADDEREPEVAMRSLGLALELLVDEHHHVRRQHGLEPAQVRVDLRGIGHDAVDRDDRGERRHDREDREQRGAAGEDRHLAEQRLARGAQPLHEQRLAGVEPDGPAAPESHAPIVRYDSPR
jgi:hypothetical protein